MLLDAQTDSEKQKRVNLIKSGSVIAWRHINLQGEYDFSEETLKNFTEFWLTKLLALQVEGGVE